MRLRSVSLRGRVDAFMSPAPIMIDFDSLGPGIVAIVGRNGCGKSSILEAAPSALFKAFPSRPGSWYDGWHGADAFVEATFSDGPHEIKVRVQIDAEHRKTESYVFLDGVSLTTGRAAEHDAEVERRFGSVSLFLSSVFSSQNKNGSFLLKKRADRKELFIELLGLGALEVLATSAKQRADGAAHDVDLARQAVRDVEAEIAGAKDEQVRLESAEAAAHEAGEKLEAARAREAEAAAALERARASGDRLKALIEAQAAAEREVKAASRAVAEANAETAKARERYAERLRFIATGKADEMEPKAIRRHQEAMQRFTERRETLERALAEAPDEDEARWALETIQVEMATHEKEAARIDALRADLRAAQAEQRAALDALRVAEKARADTKARLMRQAGLLGQAPCTVTDDWSRQATGAASALARTVGGIDLAGTCPLLADARGARDALEMLEAAGPLQEAGRLGHAQGVTLSLQAALGTADDPEERDARTSSGQALKKRELAAQQALGRAGAAVSAKAQLAGLVTEIDLEVTHHAEEIEAAREAVQAAAKEARRAADERDAAVAEAQERLTAGQEAVAQASGRLRDATAAVTVERGHGDDLSTVTAATHTATSLRKSAETALRSADLELGKARARMDALEQRAAALPDLTGRVTGCERELGDWSLLTRALGKDGAQALEIDAAGPEVSRIANELLAVYPGEAFSIAFETLREKKSARGEYAEAFDVKCFHNGREKAVEVLSGGQAVVIGEAIGLAIAIHNARKSGVKWETLWRDETAGALDPEAAQAYVLMLRRARELGGFHQVIFIAHQPEVTEAADVRLLVDAGQVAVEGQRRAA